MALMFCTAWQKFALGILNRLVEMAWNSRPGWLKFHRCCFVQDSGNSMGCFVQRGRNSIGYFEQVGRNGME